MATDIASQALATLELPTVIGYSTKHAVFAFQSEATWSGRSGASSPTSPLSLPRSLTQQLVNAFDIFYGRPLLHVMVTADRFHHIDSALSTHLTSWLHRSSIISP